MSEGLKLRRRQIINEPTEGPETCPHLEEAVPCEDPTCYSWQLVRLDPCVPRDEKICGPGTRFAHVKCVNNSGESTVRRFCIEFGDRWRSRSSQVSPEMFIWVDDVIALTGSLKDLHRVN